MYIDFDDLTEESRKELLEYAREYGISEEDVIEEFNEEAGDPDNALDFFDDDNFIEQILRDDSGLLEDYLSFVSAKIQRDLFRRYLGRIAPKKEDDEAEEINIKTDAEIEAEMELQQREARKGGTREP